MTLARPLPLLAALICAATALPAGGQDDPLGGAFVDEFDRLDAARWFVSDGWTNGPHQSCHWSARALAVDGGQLRLSFQTDAAGPGRHLCAEVQTRAVFGHGTYEARLTASPRSGMNAAFFTYIGPVHGQPHDEIDVEILGHDPAIRDGPVLSLNRFVAGVPMTTVELPLPAEGGVTVAFRWAPDRITWFVDGAPVHVVAAPLPQTPQKIYLSIWASDTLTGWMGAFVPPDQPVSLLVDWVAFTPLGAPCPRPGLVACNPVDDLPVDQTGGGP